ncbi:hypothetical protein ACTMU2_40970 [Cupriavidus basilensis]
MAETALVRTPRARACSADSGTACAATCAAATCENDKQVNAIHAPTL